MAPYLKDPDWLAEDGGHLEGLGSDWHCHPAVSIFGGIVGTRQTTGPQPA